MIKNKRLILHTILIVLVLAWIYPLIWTLSTSFKPMDEMFSNPLGLIPQRPTFENYKRAWVSANFSVYTINSFIYSITSTIIVIFLTSTAGYVLGRYHFPGKRIILIFLLATILLPSRYTFIPIFDIVRRLGLLNKITGLILAGSGVSHAMYLMLFAGYFASIPKDLEEAAIVEGASFPQIFWKVMLPISKPIIGTVAIFQFVGSWNGFLFPLILTLGNPRARTLSVGMFAFFGEYTNDWTALTAAMALSIIPTVIVFVMFQKYFFESLAGAIKG